MRLINSPTQKKIHIGCGPRNFGPEWYHVDTEPREHINWISSAHLPFRKESVDLIYASHMLEYLDRQEANEILKRWFNFLKPDGILRLAVPDFQTMAQLYLKKDFPLDSFLGPLYGKMQSNGQTIYHKTVYDADSLHKLLIQTGFKEVRFWDWRQVDHGHIDDCSQAFLPKMDKENGTLISLNLEGIK